MDPAGFASLLDQEVTILEQWTDRLIFLMSILSDAQTNFIMNVNRLSAIMSTIDAKLATYKQATNAFDAKSLKSTTQLSKIVEGWRAVYYNASLGIWEYCVRDVLDSRGLMRTAVTRATGLWDQIQQDVNARVGPQTIIAHAQVDFVDTDLVGCGYGLILERHKQDIINAANAHMNEPNYGVIAGAINPILAQGRQSTQALEAVIAKSVIYLDKIANTLSQWYVFDAPGEAKAEEQAIEELNEIFKEARILYDVLDQINDTIVVIMINISQALSGMAAVSVRLTETYNAQLGWYWTLPKTNTNAALLVGIVFFCFVALLTIIIAANYLGKSWMRTRQGLKPI